jgi:hypothetical protein
MRQLLFLEDISLLYHNKTLTIHEDTLLHSVNESDSYEKNCIYSIRVFSAHIKKVLHVTCLDDITSSVARCIEHNFEPQLKSLLSSLPMLLSLATYADGVNTLDTRLLLRKCNITCYLLAKEHGFIDQELEKMISLIQCIWRKSSSKKPNLVYNGSGTVAPTNSKNNSLL